MSLIAWKEIHWLDVDGLAIKLRDGKVTEELAFHHLLIFTALTGSGIYIPIQGSDGSDGSIGFFITIAGYAAFVLVNFYGLLHSFRVNRRGDGKHYFSRLAALTLPLSLRLLLYLILPFIIAALMFSFTDMPQQDINSIIGVAGIGVSAIYYWLMGKAFETASNNAT